MYQSIKWYERPVLTIFSIELGLNDSLIGRPNSNWSFFPFFLFFFFFFFFFFFHFFLFLPLVLKRRRVRGLTILWLYLEFEKKTGFYFNRIATCAVRWGRRKQTVKWYMMISISRSGRFFRWKMLTLIFFCSQTTYTDKGEKVGSKQS